MQISVSVRMLICMRTTLNLDDDLLRRAKQRAATEGRTLTSVIEDGLRALLSEARARKPGKVVLPTFGGDGPAPGVDLSDPRALRDALYEGEDARLRSDMGGQDLGAQKPGQTGP